MDTVEPVVFVSKFLGLKKVVIPSRYRYNNFGERVYVQGKSAQFEDGRFETMDKEIIEGLKNDKMYGLNFWIVDKDGAKTEPNEAGKREMKDEDKANDTTTNSCPHCPFKAANKTGLLAHIRSKHPDKA